MHFLCHGRAGDIFFVCELKDDGLGHVEGRLFDEAQVGVCVSFLGELSGAQDVLPISPAVGHKRLWPKAIFHRSLG